jgi:uncharacterized protein YjaZ
MNIMPGRGVARLRNSEELIETARQAVEDGYASLGEETPPDMTLSVRKSHAGPNSLNAKVPALGGGRLIVLKVPKRTEANEVYELLSHESLHSARKIMNRFQYTTVAQKIIEEGLACQFSYTHVLQTGRITGRRTVSDLPRYIFEEDMNAARAHENAQLVIDSRVNNDPYALYRIGFAALQLLRDFNDPVDSEFFLAQDAELFDQLRAAVQRVV